MSDQSSSSTSSLEFMRDYGLTRVLFEPGRSYNRSEDKDSYTFRVKTEVLKSEPIVSRLITQSLAEGNDQVFSSILRHAEESETDLGKIPFWKGHIEKISEALLDEATPPHNIMNGYKDHAIIAASMVDGYNWKALFLKVFSSQRTNNYVRQSFVKILKQYAGLFSSSFKEFVEDEVFFSKAKPSYASRSTLYSEYVERGFLTKKTARKIRSDASEETSLAGLKALVSNKESYSNYDELMLQFTDSKHEAVVCYLADHLPEYLITSIMGTEFRWAKRKLEQRLERIERERQTVSENTY